MNPADLKKESRFTMGEAVFWLFLSLVWLTNYWLKVEYLFGVDFEEQRNCLYAMGVLDGLTWNPWFYQYQPWGHGTVVFGALMIPVFLLVGPTALGLKVMAALFAFGGCAVWTLVVRRHWGRRAAFLLGLWWLLPPPFLELSWHRAWANHMESVLLMGWIVWLAFPAGGQPLSAARRFGLGLLGGFACFFCLQNVVAVAAVLVVWMLSADRWRAVRGLAPVLAGLLIGLSPHLFSPFQWFGVVAQPAAQPSVMGDFSDLFLTALPMFAGFFNKAFSVAFVALGMAGMAIMALDSVRKRVRPTGSNSATDSLTRYWPVYFGGFVAAYFVTSFKMSVPSSPYWHRYLVPLFPPLMGAIVYGALRFRRAGTALVSLFLMASLPTQYDRFAVVVAEARHREIRTSVAQMRGDDALFFATHYVPFNTQDDGPDDVANVVGALPVPWRDIAWVGVGVRRGGDGLAQALKWGARLPQEARVPFLEGVGERWAGYRSGRDDAVWLEKTRDSYRALNAENDAFGGAFVRGIGNGTESRDCREQDEVASDPFVGLLSEPSEFMHAAERDFWFGVGRRCGMNSNSQSARPYSHRFLISDGGFVPIDRPDWSRGFWAGRALLFMSTYDSVTVDWDDTDDWRRLSQAVLDTGARLEPVADQPNRYRIASHGR